MVNLFSKHAASSNGSVTYLSHSAGNLKQKCTRLWLFYILQNSTYTQVLWYSYAGTSAAHTSV